MNVLLLGGTAEARELAGLLTTENTPVVTSLAGDTSAPRLPEGETRVGGFGGATGLARYLREHQVGAVIDATHPFAARMSANGATACAATGVPLVRLSRPSWAGRPDARSWHWVDSMDEARQVAGRLGDRVFLAIGRQSWAEFAAWTDRFALARVVDLPDVDAPATWTVLRARGPFHADDELELLRSHRIDVLITKDSGGPADAKLEAARKLRLPVVVVRRPPVPNGVAVVPTVEAAIGWLRGLEHA
ncbi:MAG: cobalt-precorrin-6A reductase [Actinomycetales bacterium]|nr:cobalt-precorrin-6A reductase [Actinomycetales bacterium]